MRHSFLRISLLLLLVCAFISIIPFTANAAYVTDNLNGFYDGSSLNSGNVIDLSSSHNNGVYVNVSALSYPLGYQVMQFDGATSYLTVPVNTSNRSAFTIELQFNSSLLPQYSTLVVKDDNNHTWTPGDTPTNLLYSVVADPVNTSKYGTTGTGTVITSDTTHPRAAGSYSLKIVCDGTADYQGFVSTMQPSAANTYIEESMYLSGTGTYQMALIETNNTGSVIGTTYLNSITLTNTPTKYTVGRLSSSSGTNCRIQVLATEKSAKTFYANAMQVEKAPFDYMIGIGQKTGDNPTGTLDFWVNTASGTAVAFSNANGTSWGDNNIYVVDCIYDRYASDGKRLKIIQNKDLLGSSTGYDADVTCNYHNVTIGKFENIYAPFNLSYIRFYDGKALTQTEYVNNFCNDISRTAPRRGSIAFTFDDISINEWYRFSHDYETKYHANSTFFINGNANPNQTQIQMIREMAARGDDWGAHTYDHALASTYIAQNGTQAYLDNEINKSNEIMESWGITPRFFAYPNGDMTWELNSQLLNIYTATRTTDTKQVYYMYDGNRTRGEFSINGNVAPYDYTYDGIDYAAVHGVVWIGLSHHIVDTVTDPSLQVSYAQLDNLMAYAQSENLTIIGYHEIYGTDNGYTFPPSVNFSANSFSGINATKVQYTDLSTGTVDSWYWDFGNGQTSTEQNPIADYQKGGNYQVSLTVTNDGGSNTIIKTVAVEYKELERWDVIGGDVKQIMYLLLLIPFALAAFFIFRMISGEDVDSKILLTIGMLALVLIIVVLILMKVLEVVSGVA